MQSSSANTKWLTSTNAVPGDGPIAFEALYPFVLEELESSPDAGVLALFGLWQCHRSIISAHPPDGKSLKLLMGRASSFLQPLQAIWVFAARLVAGHGVSPMSPLTGVGSLAAPDGCKRKESSV